MECRVQRTSANGEKTPEVANVKGRTYSSRLCADVEDERDIMVWDPRSQLSEEQMNEYLRGAEKRNALSDKTHEVLSFFNYNVEKSLGFCSDFVVAELFSDAEKTVVRHSVKIKHFRPLKSHNKFFTLKRLLPRQTPTSITKYYCMNKLHNFSFITRARTMSKKVEIASEHPSRLKTNQLLKRKNSIAKGMRRKSCLLDNQWPCY
uniref:ELM2 domain-containing protein n=1 Tax=Haemonchus contortus TaxID=6289 RepID=A0A7I4Z3E6_HAECO